MKTLILSKEDIEKLLNMPMAIASVEQAYRIFQEKKLMQPPIMSIDIPEHDGELDIKSCYSQEDEIISIKNASGYWQNAKDHDLPNLIASIILLDGKTGYPLCIMDGGMITGYRTGAAGGLSARLLARKGADTVGVIGAGNQARMQLRAIKNELNIKTVKVWSPSQQEMEAYKQDMEMALEVVVKICATPEQAVIDSDIVVTCTPGRQAIVQDEWVGPGTHIVAVGADMEGKQEVDEKIYGRAYSVCDSIDQCLERGETRNAVVKGIITRHDIKAEIGELVLQTKPGRTSDDQITIFDTTGMGIQDNTLAVMLYKQALEEGMGQAVDLLSLIK